MFKQKECSKSASQLDFRHFYITFIFDTVNQNSTLRKHRSCLCFQILSLLFLIPPSPNSAKIYTKGSGGFRKSHFLRFIAPIRQHLPIYLSNICRFGITTINRNYTSAGCPCAPSFYRGTVCTGSASCFCPRTSPCSHGAALYDPPLLPVCIFPATNTPHKEDAHEGMLCSPYAMRRCILSCLQGVCIQDAKTYVRHNTSARIQQAHHSRDACTVFSVCTAYPFLPCKKDAPHWNAP